MVQGKRAKGGDVGGGMRPARGHDGEAVAVVVVVASLGESTEFGLIDPCRRFEVVALLERLYAERGGERVRGGVRAARQPHGGRRAEDRRSADCQ